MKTESVLKFYFYHITIGNYVQDYFSTVDTGDIFRTTIIKNGDLCYRKDKQFIDTILFDTIAISVFITVGPLFLFIINQEILCFH